MRKVPQRSSRTILSDVPYDIWLFDDIEDLEDVFVLNLAEFLVDLLLLGDVLKVALTLLDLADSDGIVEVRIKDAEDLS